MGRGEESDEWVTWECKRAEDSSVGGMAVGKGLGYHGASNMSFIDSQPLIASLSPVTGCRAFVKPLTLSVLLFMLLSLGMLAVY